MIRALWELACAVPNYLIARIRGLADPCPPHDFSHGRAFCEKCGKTHEQIEAGE